MPTRESRLFRTLMRQRKAAIPFSCALNRAARGRCASSARSEAWRAVDTASRQGPRGLPGGSSLAQRLGRLKARASRTRAMAG